MMNKMEDFILLDQRATIKMIKNETHFSYGSIWKIIHEELQMSKILDYGFHDY